MARVPDFGEMQHRGLAVFDEGLPPLPEELKHSDSVPVSYWTTGVCGAVQFIFFFQDDEDGFHPADVTFQYGYDVHGWHAIKTPQFWSDDWTGSIGSPNFMRHHPHQVIETSHTSIDDEGEPGRLAIVMSGRHSPDVAEIWLVQGDRTEKRTTSGHFGSWTICTEDLLPLRVEAHDAAGSLLGVIDERLDAYFPEPELRRVQGPDSDQPHRHGGRIQIQEVGLYEAKVVVSWVITLVPDPDVRLVEDLDAHGYDSADPWTLERIDQHVKLLDVLKLTAFFSQITLTDALGTEYESGGGGNSIEHGEATQSTTFKPAVPEEARIVTVHWENLDFPISLR